MAEPTKIFIAYSREDEEHLDSLRKHFLPAQRKGKVEVWYDGAIAAGAVWEEAIKENLHKADIILLLVSIDSLASDQFYGNEMKTALERQRDGLTRVIPIILRPCNWEETELADLQALPKNGKPVTQWDDEEEAYLDIAMNVLKTVGRKAAKQKSGQEGQESLVEKQAQGPPASVEMKMVLVEGGRFQMGSKNGKDDEEPVHDVSLSSYYIGRTAVTQAQWRAVMGNNPSHFKNMDDCPVEKVSWEDAQVFIQKLNAQTGKQYRLPTEAEWEFAARGGNLSQDFIYSGSNDVNEVAWYERNAKSKTQPVASKRPNELGIFDMGGNVMEWCADWYGPYVASGSTSDEGMLSFLYKTATGTSNKTVKDPQGPPTGEMRVSRGTSWLNSSDNCRPSARFYGEPKSRMNIRGFRLVL